MSYIRESKMTFRNKLHNWIFRVRRYRAKGCHNVGLKFFVFDGKDWVVKYDWSLPFTYQTKKYGIDYGSFEKHRAIKPFNLKEKKI